MQEMAGKQVLLVGADMELARPMHIAAVEGLEVGPGVLDYAAALTGMLPGYY